MQTRVLSAASLCLLMLLVLPAFAAPPEKDLAAETARIEKTLAETKVAEIQFNQQEIRDVIEHFRQQFKMNVHVDWKALQAVGVDKSAPITLKLTDVTVGRALQVVLDELQGAARLGYIVDKGVLTISTKDALTLKTITRIFPAADLLCRTRRAFTVGGGIPWRKTTFIPEKREGEMSGAGGGLFGAAGGQVAAEEATPEEAAQELIDLILTTIAPDTWRSGSSGGTIGSIRMLGTDLVITTNHEVQEQVAELLEMLRAGRRTEQVQIGIAVVRMKANNAEKLRAILAKGGDIAAALIAGETADDWVLDRNQLEQAILGDVIRARHIYARNVTQPVPATETDEKGNKEWAPIILEHATVYGYEVGVLPKTRADGKVTVSVACGAAWVGDQAKPEEDTPTKNAGVQRRHNVFETTLSPGEAKAFPVVPWPAKDGGVVAVVWLPKE